MNFHCRKSKEKSDKCYRVGQGTSNTADTWGASSPLCWFNNKEFLCITHTVKHNYISLPSSTVGTQLHVSALYVCYLQVVLLLTDQLYKMCWVFLGDWVGGGERDLVVPIVGTTFNSPRSWCPLLEQRDLVPPPNPPNTPHLSCIADL